MFAWESSPRDGHDATLAPTGWSEQHISLDAASGVWEAALVLDDIDYYREVAYPVLRDVCDWLISRGTFTDRGFEVRAVGGPDESIGKVDNNLYFNAAGMRVLRAVVDCVSLLPGVASRRKLMLWQRALDQFVIPTTTDGGATVAKPFDQAPSSLASATVNNWSLGSLQYLWTHGIGRPAGVTSATGTMATAVVSAVASEGAAARVAAGTSGDVRGAVCGAVSEALFNATYEAEEALRKRFSRGGGTGSVPCSNASEYFICAPLWCPHRPLR